MSENYRFAVLGPFEVPTKMFRSRKVVDFDRAADEVFEEANAACLKTLGIKDDVRNAIGCYVFALSPSGGKVVWPYYVGQARKQSLYKRTFQLTDKPKTYNSILKEYKKARVLMYIIPLITPAKKFARIGSNEARINNAEHALIGMALRVNYSLWNIKHRAAMEAYTIDGTPESGRKDTNAAKSFRHMLGFATKPKLSGRAVGELEPNEQPEDLLPDEDPVFEAASEIAQSLSE